MQVFDLPSAVFQTELLALKVGTKPHKSSTYLQFDQYFNLLSCKDHWYEPEAKNAICQELLLSY